MGRTLQTAILALYDVPDIQRAQIIVDPRIREVRKYWAADCQGKDYIHMRAVIMAQFAELDTWRQNNDPRVANRGVPNMAFRTALLAAVNTAHTAGNLPYSESSLGTQWFKNGETESSRGKEFVGGSGMWS